MSCKVYAQTCGCVGCPQTIPIVDNTFVLDYIVSGLSNDDLSGTQCIDSIKLKFQHNRIQNLVIELISPAGQIVPLIGPYQQFGGGLNGSLGATWDVNFVQCFPDGQANPDPGAGEVWSNMDGAWNVFGGSFTGTYYPAENNCLQSFDMGSANGTWQLRVQNFSFPPPAGAGLLESIEIIFCDESGVGCCGADAGTIFSGVPPLNICESSSNLTFNGFEPDYGGGDEPNPSIYGYQFLITRNDSIIVVQESIDLNGLPDGTYRIYGFSYLLSDAATVNNFAGNVRFSDLTNGTIDICNDISSNAFRITLEPALAVVPAMTSICEGDSVMIGGEFRKMAGVYREIIPVPDQECDSIIDYTLSIIPIQTFPVGGDFCEGDSFPFAGQMLTEAGIYRDTLQSTAGCDSIVILDLTILPISRNTLNESICLGESFPFDGQNLTVADTYEAIFTSANNCDSIVTLNLSVLDIFRDTLDESICEGQFFPFDGQDLTIANTYEAIFTSQSGCDSIVTLNLAVTDALRDTLNEQICEGQFFPFDGQDLTIADTYEATFISQSGCDSIVTLNLAVTDVLRDTLNEQICQGQIFPFDGQDLTDADTYEATFTSQSGCDSIVTLNLAVTDVLRDTLNEQICEGQIFPFDGQDLTIADTYEATFTSQSGCDSIVTLNLAITDVLRDTLNEQICRGQIFPFDGQDLTISDIYEATFTSQSGCDSIVTLNLAVTDVLRDTLNEAICQGQTFPFDGQDLTIADIYEAIFTSQSGCDSIVTLNLAVTDVLRDTLNEQICEGQIFPFDGQDLTDADTYEATFISQSGCDSIVTLNLAITDVLHDTLNEQICEGQTFPFDGQDLTIADTYEATFTSQSGCDSIVTLNLAITDVLRDTLNEAICQGQTFPFDGQDLTIADTYEATFISQSGCDSIVTLNLAVTDVLRDTLNEQICQGQIFPFDGQDLTDADTYEATFISQSGCDSIVTLNLAVTDVLRDTLNEQICEGQIFPFDGQDLTIADTYEATFTSQSGCDSIVTLNLAVTDVLRDTLNEQICEGQIFPFDGQDLTIADTYEAIFTSQSGCDSIVTLNLAVTDVLRDTLNEAICQGQTFPFDGQDLTIADTYEATFISQSGCDSIVTLNLAVTDVLRDTLNEQICQGQIFPFDGQDLTDADTYEATFISQSGCDSIVTLNLAVTDVLRDTLNEQICEGQSFPFDGQNLTIADTYEAIFTSQSGCDSIVTLNLAVTNVLRENIEEQICAGDSFSFGNRTLTTAGIYTDTLSAVSGCDSIVKLDLKVSNLSANILSESSAIGCEFVELQLSAEIDGDFIEVQWLKDGELIDSVEQIIITEEGEYQLIVENESNCIAEDIIEISEQLGGINNAVLNIQQPNCEGNEVGNVAIDSVFGGVSPYTFAIEEEAFSTNPRFRNLEIGTYLFRIQDAQGCEWDTTITILPATDLTVNLGGDIVLPFGESAVLEAIINKAGIDNINWSSSGKDSLSCMDCLEQIVSPVVSTVYQIRVEDEDGCIATDWIEVFVERVSDFFLPNVFSPNGDNRNDFFYLQSNNSAVAEIESFQIFDRWGHLVFSRNNFSPNDETLGWDGRSQNGVPMNPAVFIFTAKVNYVDGSMKFLEGEVTLLK